MTQIKSTQNKQKHQDCQKIEQTKTAMNMRHIPVVCDG